MTREEERRQNRDRIIRAAVEQFLANGIDKATIAEIAERANLTPMSVYRYFGTKQNIAVDAANYLLRAFMEEHRARCADRMSAGATSGFIEFSHILHAYIDTYEANADFIRFAQDMTAYAMRENLMDSMDYFQFSSTTQTYLETPAREALLRGIEDGSVRKDIHLEMVHLSIVNLLTGGVNFRNYIGKNAPIDIFRSSAEIIIYYVETR